MVHYIYVYTFIFSNMHVQGKVHERIVEQWNALIKKRIVKDSK